MYCLKMFLLWIIMKKAFLSISNFHFERKFYCWKKIMNIVSLKYCENVRLGDNSLQNLNSFYTKPLIFKINNFIIFLIEAFTYPYNILNDDLFSRSTIFKGSKTFWNIENETGHLYFCQKNKIKVMFFQRKTKYIFFCNNN